MTPLRTLSAATCAALLGGTAAMAGPMAVNPTQEQQDSSMQQPQATPYTSSDMMSDKAAAASEAGVEASALSMAQDQPPGTVSVETVTNGPVPDTPENRARFGGPNSRSGKMTAASGN